MNSLSIIHENSLIIDRDYYNVKSNIQAKLGEWSDLFRCDDSNHQIHYKTEGPLIPEDNSKIPVLILLSNPHPHSIKQGMFLSPNRSGKENPFWETMRDSGYFQYNGSIGAELMIRNKYLSPFRFFMAVLLPFPSEDPTHLKDIFGIYIYQKMLSKGKNVVNTLIMDNNIKHLVCFGRLQYDLISLKGSPDNYTSILNQDKIIRDVTSFSDGVSIYLTYPTGWRFVKDYNRLKSCNLRNIFVNILNKG